MNAQFSDDGKCLYETGIDAQQGNGSKDPHASLVKVGKPDAPATIPEQQRNSPKLRLRVSYKTK